MSNPVTEVDRLLSELRQNLEDAKLSLKQQQDLLARVKVLGRDINAADPIFTKSGIATLSRYGLDEPSSDSSREALRCLANAFLLNERARQFFVDLDYGPKAAERLKVNSNDEEFLISRILFLMTYNTTLDFTDLITTKQLADSIFQCLARHAQTYGQETPSKSGQDGMGSMALTETLKLIFNITYYSPQLSANFAPCLESIVTLTLKYPLTDPPLQAPLSSLINVLLNLDSIIPGSHEPQSQSDNSLQIIFPGLAPTRLVERLISIFDMATQKHREEELEQAAAPLCTLLRRLHELAPQQVKLFMRSQILPNDKARDKPLGRGDSFPDRLLRLSTSPKLLTLKDNISNLLFELSNKDANQFVQNIGYGFASGFLISHNIQVSPDSMGDQASGSDAYNESGAPINPITGQRLDSEARGMPPTAPMTEEEKEREAERLFVLFERLKATGVVDVKNPVEQAIEDGRFEELD